MSDSLPRAPTFPAFVDNVDQVEEIDDSDFVDPITASPGAAASAILQSAPDATPISATLRQEPNLPFMSSQPAAGEPSTPSADVPVVELPVASRKSVVRNVLLWRDPKLSAIYFGCTMVFFYFTLLRGESVLSVFGMLFALYQLIGTILVNVNKRVGHKLDKHISRPPPGTPFMPHDVAARWTQTFVDEVNDVQDILRDIIYCDTIQVSGACFLLGTLLYFIGHLFSVLSVVFVATLALFSLPLAYEKNKKQVDDVIAKTSETVSRQVTIGQRMASEKTAELLDKAPPAARDLANRVGFTPKKKVS